MKAAGGVIVHAGPTLPAAIRATRPHWIWRPPAVAGDALRALTSGASVFVLIDGVFDGECAIRHNELLKLLAAGIHVIGAASMGALRAAELDRYGMVGVGRIFEAYRDGRLMGDDEVALLHAPEELDWLAITAPLVNIRATLSAARRSGRLSGSAARCILRRAQAVCFTERTWGALLSDTDPAGDALADWLDVHAVDLKRRDGLEALDRAGALQNRPAARSPEPPHTLFSAALARALQSHG